jgi:protein-S-isoprenylcysteine O-methyltransferase Ste14
VASETESKQGGARVRFPPPLVFLAGIGVGVALQRLVAPLRLGLAAPVRVALGVAIAVAGGSLLVWASSLFKRTGQDPRPWLPSPSMIAQGPYRFTRNPMYLGMTLIQIAVGIFIDDLWVCLFAGAALLVVHFIAVRPEEAYLGEKFGEDYARYRASVRRYLVLALVAAAGHARAAPAERLCFERPKDADAALDAHPVRVWGESGGRARKLVELRGGKKACVRVAPGRWSLEARSRPLRGPKDADPNQCRSSPLVLDLRAGETVNVSVAPLGYPPTSYCGWDLR